MQQAPLLIVRTETQPRSLAGTHARQATPVNARATLQCSRVAFQGTGSYSGAGLPLPEAHAS